MAKRSKVPFRSGRKTCIFCGGTPVTAEHIWPQWCRDLMPPGPDFSYNEMAGVAGSHKPTKNYKRQGPITSLRVTRVCGPCNNGWMNEFETAVRPALTRMMAGKSVALTCDTRILLAKYFTYKFLILDWCDTTPTLPPVWSHEFYSTKSIAENTSIHILNCIEGPMRSAHVSYSVHISSLKSAQSDTNVLNTKTTAIGFGNLFIVAVFSPEVDLHLELDPTAAIRLWPVIDEVSVNWPPRYPISSFQAYQIALALGHLREASDAEPSAANNP